MSSASSGKTDIRYVNSASDNHGRYTVRRRYHARIPPIAMITGRLKARNPYQHQHRTIIRPAEALLCRGEEPVIMPET